MAGAFSHTHTTYITIINYYYYYYYDVIIIKQQYKLTQNNTTVFSYVRNHIKKKNNMQLGTIPFLVLRLALNKYHFCTHFHPHLL